MGRASVLVRASQLNPGCCVRNLIPRASAQEIMVHTDMSALIVGVIMLLLRVTGLNPGRLVKWGLAGLHLPVQTG